MEVETEVMYSFLSPSRTLYEKQIKHIRNLLVLLGYPDSELATPRSITLCANSSDVVIAQRRLVIIGIARLVTDVTFTEKSGIITDVVVMEEFRRQKVATEMIRQLLFEARRRGIRNLSVTADPTNVAFTMFLVKHGFSESVNISEYSRRI